MVVKNAPICLKEFAVRQVAKKRSYFKALSAGSRGRSQPVAIPGCSANDSQVVEIHPSMSQFTLRAKRRSNYFTFAKC